jgi:hypothetical protein
MKLNPTVRLNATFVMMDGGHQEQVVVSRLRKLKFDVQRMDHTARADNCTVAIFVNPIPLHRPGRTSSKSVNFMRLGHVDSAKEMDIKVPEWAKEAQGLIAMNPLSAEQLRDKVLLSRLTDALRESCRASTRRARQADMRRRLEAKSKRPMRKKEMAAA